MAASFPTSVKTYTTKTDGIDDVMAADINSLQEEVTALENYLKDGWALDGAAWTYYDTPSFWINGDVRSRFPVGTKVRLKQGGAYKYFYVTGTQLVDTITVVTVTGGSAYSLANAAITDTSYSYAETPQGFPDYFAYTPVWTASGTAPALGNGSLTGKFNMRGKNVLAFIILTAGTTTTFGTGLWHFSLPVFDMSGLVGGGVTYDATPGVEYGGLSFQTLGSQKIYGLYQGAYVGPSAPQTWAVGDVLKVTMAYLTP